MQAQHHVLITDALLSVVVFNAHVDVLLESGRRAVAMSTLWRRRAIDAVDGGKAGSARAEPETDVDVAGVMAGLDRSIQQPAVVVNEAYGMRFGDGGRSEEMRATVPATTKIGSSSHATVVDVVLPPQWIWHLLYVCNVMDDLDYSMGCPPSVGLLKRRMTLAVAVQAVETSPSMAGICRR
ncbi:hypothetical protein ACLOJK_024349 [Asimina triloba]